MAFVLHIISCKHIFSVILAMMVFFIIDKIISFLSAVFNCMWQPLLVIGTWAEQNLKGFAKEEISRSCLLADKSVLKWVCATSCNRRSYDHFDKDYS